MDEIAFPLSGSTLQVDHDADGKVRQFRLQQPGQDPSDGWTVFRPVDEVGLVLRGKGPSPGPFTVVVGTSRASTGSATVAFRAGSGLLFRRRNVAASVDIVAGIWFVEAPVIADSIAMAVGGTTVNWIGRSRGRPSRP